jgi:two-component system chemotaxis response regulator CheB
VIRVVIAEDSPTVRELLAEILGSDPEIQVVGRAENGEEAVALTKALKPDLVTMDAHMPRVDGVEATKTIMMVAPTPIVIVSSSTSTQHVELSLEAVRAGALMVVAKPEDPRSAGFDERRNELVAMVKAMAQVKVVRRRPADARPKAPVPARTPLRSGPMRVVTIAASTGGPAALQRILMQLPRDFRTPILVVQHMAKGFMDGLAAWLSDSTGARVKVVQPGDGLEDRTTYLAPDDRHLGVSADARLIVADDPPIGGFRPSGTYLFASAARAYGSSVVAVILTGMGSDGVEGLRAVKAAGGLVFAQDEPSSVVYGMPREAVAAGVVDGVYPPDELAEHLSIIYAGTPPGDLSGR